MPTIGDISQFLGGQTFGRTTVPDVDLSGKTIIVTGSNTGLGFECAKHLVRLGLSKLIIACRNIEKGEAAKSKIHSEIVNKNNACTIEIWQVDLCDYKSVLTLIGRVNSSLPRLDGFIANAGVEMTTFELCESLETTLTVNLVSTYLLAIGVLPKLEETSSRFNEFTNLSIVGSLIHTFGPDAQLEISESENILEALSDPQTAEMGNRYPLSKLMAHQCFHQFAERASTRATENQKGVVIVNLVNPGWCASELSRYKSESLPQRAIFAAIGRTAEEGSRTLVHAVTAGRESHNRYLSECQIKCESQYMQSERGRSISRRLWKELVERIQSVSPEVATVVS